MSTEVNNPSSTTRNLPAAPEPGSPSDTRRPTTDTRAPSPGSAGLSGLADHDRRRHREWRMRHLLAEAEHWMQTRVRHPDGGERTVAETQADEEEQRQQIKRETALGSLKHRRLPRWLHWIPKFVLFFDFIL